MLSWPWPDEANPYVLRLGESLAARGVSVRPARYLAAHVPRVRGARWLHVHWPEWMTRAPSRTAYRARLAWQMTLLDALRLQGVSLAWTAHNLHAHDDPHADLEDLARRALLRRCAVVFGHFPSAESDLRSLGFSGRFACTPHPHYDRDFARPFADDVAREAWRAAQGVSPDDVLLVSAGAIEPYKNLLAVADALKALAPSRVRWIVAGRIGDHGLFAELARRVEGLDFVSLRPGFVARDEMARLVAGADASLVAYRAFYTSGSAVLSLTLETPVIGPPQHHLAGWNGAPFFAPLTAVNADALGRAIERVRAMGPSVRRAARDEALSNSWDDAARVIDTTLFGESP